MRQARLSPGGSHGHQSSVPHFGRCHGHHPRDIAARIDRRPLTRIQYGYAAITQISWGLIIATYGMPARLYPFLWEPRGMSNFEFSVLLSADIGAGILIGEYLGSFLADRFGRKKILVLAPIIDAVFLWVSLPCALVPSLLIGRFGMNQRGAVLEQIST